MDLKAEVDKKLTPEAVLQIYTELLGEGRREKDNEYKFKSPFSKENTPSFGVDPERLGMYKCFSSGESGNIYTLLQKLKKDTKPLLWLADRFGIKTNASAGIKYYVPVEKILQCHEYLMGAPHLVKVLKDFNISEDVMSKFMIGYCPDDHRYWWPIKVQGKFVNVRRYKPGNKEFKVINYTDEKCKSEDGKPYKFGAAVLWPEENLNADEIFIFEGEKDTLVALSAGINAICPTCGADTWYDSWSARFKNKSVVIVQDNDDAGIRGAAKKAKSLAAAGAAQVKIIIPPVEKKGGDFCDYISMGGTKESFLSLVNEAQVYVSEVQQASGEFNVLLNEASKSCYAGKVCSIKNIIVSGKDMQPYHIPKKIEYTCKSQDSEKCTRCRLFATGSLTIDLERTDTAIIEMIAQSSTTVDQILRRIAHVSCKRMIVTVLDKYTCDRLRLVPNTTFNIGEQFSYAVRTGVFVYDVVPDKAKEIETNKIYDIKAVTATDPKNQAVIHQIFDMAPGHTSVDSFTLDQAMYDRLSVFKREDGQTIREKLANRYSEFSKMARVYGREDLMLMYDLAFHSPITFDFQGQTIGKGWIEVCAVGDSGVGKTKLVRFLHGHYRSGELIDGESLTEAGLKGGLSQVNGQYQLNWGRLPINDRGLVTIDEASGMAPEVLAALSNIRSSGECTITKVMSNKTMARTRIIFITNPRKNNTGIANYTFGVETIKDFFIKPEDVRRCDLAMTVASGEVDTSVINSKHQVFNSRYSSDVCHDLVTFAWSRKAEEIYIEPDAEDAILSWATKFGSKYTPMIPLVEASDMRNKIARLSVALAIILFNADKSGLVTVTKEIVDYMCNTIMSIYSKPRMAYDLYSSKEMKKNILEDPEIVDVILHIGPGDPNAAANVQLLLEYGLISKDNLSEVMDVSPLSDEFRKGIRTLKSKNAIAESGERKFKLTPGLIAHLRSKTNADVAFDFKEKF